MNSMAAKQDCIVLSTNVNYNAPKQVFWSIQKYTEVYNIILYAHRPGNVKTFLFWKFHFFEQKNKKT